MGADRQGSYTSYMGCMGCMGCMRGDVWMVDRLLTHKMFGEFRCSWMNLGEPGLSCGYLGLKLGGAHVAGLAGRGISSAGTKMFVSLITGGVASRNTT